MSKILAEELLAGIILADNDNEEYIYLPGGEVGRPAAGRSGRTCQTPAPCPRQTPRNGRQVVLRKYTFSN